MELNFESENMGDCCICVEFEIRKHGRLLYMCVFEIRKQERLQVTLWNWKELEKSRRSFAIAVSGNIMNNGGLRKSDV